MKVIITGGPGFGKTSIINYLSKQGFTSVGESSRALITELRKKEGRDPRNNRERFQQLIINRRIEDYNNISGRVITFFDRGVPDELAYSLYYKQQPTAELVNFLETEKYYNKVFFTPPRKEIYKLDDIRRETYDKAEKIHAIILKTYKNLGYECILLPKVSIAKRGEYVKKILGI